MAIFLNVGMKALCAALAVVAVWTPAGFAAPNAAVPVVVQATRDDPARLARLACVRVGQPAHCGLIRSSRKALGGGVAEYTFLLRVGPGDHDRIQVHRVVRESGAPKPGRAAFFVHGDVWGFDAVFAGALGGPKRAPNVARYLADHHVDVWGIDLRWVLVPAATTDTSFMHGWGFSTNLSDLRLATTFERIVRAASGANDKTALVGWSRGATLAYAYASRETQLPTAARNVDALVPADGLVRYAPDDPFRRGQCDAYLENKAAYDDGESAVSFADFTTIGRAALDDPDGPSPIISGLTNHQAALQVGAGVNGFFNAGFHFIAARFDPSGVPTTLRYTPDPRWLGMLTRAASWESFGDFVDGGALFCGEVDVPFDDHLADVRLPVLYLAPAGGFGTTGLYSTTLLRSRDVTRVVVRLQPRGNEATDFAHVDMWYASRAPDLVWKPMLHWLRQH